MKLSMLKMSIISALFLSYNSGCSTKNDDGEHESTLITAPEAKLPLQKSFRTSTGECSPDFQKDLINESLYSKLQALKDQQLSQSEEGSQSLQILEEEALKSCDVIIGTYDRETPVIDSTMTDGTVQNSETCDVMGSDQSVHKTYSLADIKARCAEASQIHN